MNISAIANTAGLSTSRPAAVSTRDAAAPVAIARLTTAPPKDSATAIDANRLDATLKANADAQRNALSALERQGTTDAARGLAENGGNESQARPTGNRDTPQEGRQAEDQARMAVAQQAINTQAVRPNIAANTAIAAYQRVFSL